MPVVISAGKWQQSVSIRIVVLTMPVIISAGKWQQSVSVRIVVLTMPVIISAGKWQQSVSIRIVVLTMPVIICAGKWQQSISIHIVVLTMPVVISAGKGQQSVSIRILVLTMSVVISAGNSLSFSMSTVQHSHISYRVSEFKPCSLFLPTSCPISPLNAKLNPICHLLALAGGHHFVHVSRLRDNCSLTVIHILSLNALF